MMVVNFALGFVAAGTFYGAISSFLRHYFKQRQLDEQHKNPSECICGQDPFKVPNFIENLLLLVYMTHILISLGMGKHID